MPVMPNCPRCGRNDCVELTTPDYGFGYGAEFMCYRDNCKSRLGYEPRFTSSSPEAKAISDASRAQSAANAAAYCRGKL